jgi:hypothetical protein
MPRSGSTGQPPGLAQSSIRPSSQGDSPVIVTPKDVEPDDATAKDITERKLNSGDLEVRQEALLDDAIELSFPASDPISVPSYDMALEKSYARKKAHS